MSTTIRIEDMTADEIAARLHVTVEQAAAIRDFIQQVGGVKNAQQAVELLSRLRKAA